MAAWVASVPSELPLIPFAMPIPWRAAAESFEQFLRKHGVGPAAVTDVEAAWRAFVEFSQTEIDGVAPADEDGDGFIVQWGRHSWDNNRLGLTLTRQLAVVDLGEQIEADDPDRQQLWQVELTMAFDDELALVALEAGLDAPDTGFRFDPIGPLRAAALAEVRVQAQRQELVEAMWTATPVHSELTFECVC
ncbi:hypothetical protein [Nocardia grenadensis]|uniref:hypothetical protein n=1 Tax=Nocardia grenadensis TaxID=931537 RepID=UPI003D72A8A9